MAQKPWKDKNSFLEYFLEEDTNYSIPHNFADMGDLLFNNFEYQLSAEFYEQADTLTPRQLINHSLCYYNNNDFYNSVSLFKKALNDSSNNKNNSVKLIGNPKNKGGVLSFTVEGVHPHDIATILDEDGVAIRAGHHCCQILHEKLNISASARASVGIYNTKEDLEKLNNSIDKCKKIFNLR